MKRILLLLVLCFGFGASYSQYCTTGLYSTGCIFGDDLDGFSLGSFSHTGTGCSGTESYNDYTSMVIPVTQTIPQTMTITTNYTSASEYASVYIDYNSDYDFDDPGEEIFTSTTGFSASSPETDVITFPAGSPTGTFRLRVRTVWLSPATDACSNHGYGEAHDYTIQIDPNIEGDCANYFSNFDVDSISGTGAKVDWTPGTGNSSFYFEYGPVGFSPGSGTMMTGTYPGSEPPLILSGLSPETTYDFYFGEICNSGADSAYYPIVKQFTTTKLCASPTDFAVANLASTSIDLTWNQAGTVQDYWIIHGIPGFDPATGGIVGTSTSMSYTISGLSPGRGYEVYLATNCAGGNGISDTIGPLSIKTPLQSPQGITCPSSDNTLLLSGELDDNNAGIWTGDIGTFTGMWIFGNSITSGTGPSSAYSGSGYIHFDASGAGPASLISPAINLVPATDDAELTFWMHAYGADVGYLVIRASTVSANGPFNDTIFLYNAGELQESGSEPWQQVGVDLSNYLGQTLWVEFEAGRTGTGTAGDIALDLVEVNTCGSYCLPEIFELDSITINSFTDATVYIDTSGDNFQLEWGPTGYTQGTGTFVTGTSPFNLNTLQSSTCYDVYVRRNCGAGNGFSSWGGPFSFCTPCEISPITLPFAEGFEVFTDEVAWDTTLVCGLGYSWDIVRPGNTGSISFDYSPSGGPGAPYNGNRSAGFASLSTANPIYMILTMDMSTYATSGDPIQLSFYYADHLDETNAEDKVWIRGSDTSPWIQIFDWNAADATTDWGYVEIMIDSALAANGQAFSANTQIRWGQQDNAGLTGSDGFSIDDVVVQVMTCPDPNGLSAINVTSNSADLFWKPGTPGNSDFELSLGVDLNDPLLGTRYILTDTSFAATGLLESTGYCYFVREICGPSDTSLWKGPYCFATPCPDNCIFDVDMYDTFGDGWHGAEISIFQNGAVVASFGTSFTSGDSLVDVQAVLCDSVEAHAILTTAGTFPGEIEFKITSPYPTVVADYTASPATQGDTLASFFVSCELPNCARPKDLMVSGVASDSAVLSWTPQSAVGMGYQISYGSGIASPSAGTMVMTSDTAFNLSGLTEATGYCYYVRSVCSTTDTSLWAGPFCFMTDCSTGSCTYTANLYDTFGDGWNGAEISFVQNGSTVATIGSAFTTGDSLVDIPVSLCDSLTTYVVLTSPGSFSGEIGFAVNSPLNIVAASHTASSGLGLGDTLAVFDAMCATPTCGVYPDSLWADVHGSDTAEMYWRPYTSNATMYEVSYGVGISSPQAGTVVQVTDTALGLSGLIPASTYCYYVRALCGSDTSVWSGPKCFFTSCATGSCTYTADLYDTFGDGWNGAEISFWQNGSKLSTIGSGFTTGGSLVNISVSLCDSIPTYVVLTSPGTFSGEIEFDIHTPYSTLAASHTATSGLSQGDTLAVFFTECVAPTCPMPTAASISNITSTSADVTWTTGGASHWQIEYGPDGFTLGTGTVENVSAIPYTITGLNSTTAYDIYIRDSCGPTDKSNWLGPISFMTTATCFPPSALAASNITMTSADISWVTGGASDWQLEYGPVGFTPGTGTFVNNATNPHTLTGLSAATTYQVYVRDSCGTGDVSLWTGPYTFSTTICQASNSCTYVADLYDTFGDGWNGAEIGVYQNGIHTQTLGTSFTGGASVLGVSVPLCDSLTTYLIMENPGTFPGEVEMDIFTPYGTLAASHTASTISAGDTLAVFYTECTPPTCPKPDQLGVGILSSNSAEFIWRPGTFGNQDFQMSYGAGISTPAGGTVVTVTDSSYTVTGLTANTNYCYFVREICAVGDSSSWSGPYCFTTLCAALPTPHLESFDNTTIPNCWSTYSSGTETFGFGTNTYAPSTDHTGNGGYYAHVDDSESPASSDVTLESPLFDVSTLTNPVLTFYLASADATVNVSVDVWDGNVWHAGVWSHASATSSTWDSLFVNLGPFANSDTIAFRFVVDEDNGTFENDIAIDDIRVTNGPSCIGPIGLGVITTTANTAEVYWTSGGAANWNVVYGPVGFSPANAIPINSTNDTLTISGLSASTDYEFYVRDSCGTNDVSGWVGPVSFTTLCATFPTPHLESFDNTTIPNCWSTYSSGTETFLFGTNTYAPSTDNTGNGGYYANVDDSESPSSSDVTLESPLFDISTLTNPVLSFYLASADATVSLSVDIWDGTTWNTGVFTHAAATAGMWDSISISLVPYSALDTIAFRFIVDENNGTYQNDIAIDDIRVTNGPSCPAPYGLASSGATTTSVNLAWNSAGASAWQIEYGPVGFTPGTGTMVNVLNNPYTLTGLTAATNYDVYLRDSCGAGDVSTWIGPLKITTRLCPASQSCSFTADLADTYGDGWNGARIAFIQNGFVVQTLGASFTSGYSLNGLAVDLCTGIPVDIVLSNAGTNPAELEFSIYSGGTQMAAHVAATGLLPGDTLASFTPTCTFTCPAPSNLTISNITSSSADISWTTGGASDWQIAYGPFGFTPGAGAGAIVNVNTNPYTLPGLTPGTVYDVYVRDSCGVGDVSTWTGPISMTSATVMVCDPVTNITAGTTTCESVSITWTSNSGTSIVEYGPAGFVQGQGTLTAVVTSPYSVPGLAPGTAYDFYVADVCSGDTSTWNAAPVTVTSATGPLPVANIAMVIDSVEAGVYYVEFDASASTDAVIYEWDFGNNSTGSGAQSVGSYSQGGTFTVTLVVSNGCGTDTATYTVHSPISIDENALGRSLSVYPNPTHDDVTIEFDAQGSAEALIRVTDLRGREIKRIEYRNVNGRFSQEVSLEGLAKGIYMVEINSGDMRAYRRINLQ